MNKKKLAAVFWICFCVLFAGYLLYCNIRILEKRVDIKKSSDKLNESISSLTKQKETLSFTLGQTYSEDYIEKVAREDLGMQKSGEEVVVIKKEGESQSGTSGATENVWEKITDWFNSIISKF